MVSRALAFSAFALAALTATASPSYRYVDGDVAVDGDGLSWATAWKAPGHNSSMNVPGRIQYIKASSAAYPNFYLSGLTGTASEHIQFIGVPGPRGARPYIVQSASGQTGGAYWPSNLHYIDVTNVDAYNPPSLNPNGSCFFIGSTGGAGTVDHITLGLPWPDDTGLIVKGFSAIGCGGDGVNAEYDDYNDIENGLVADNGQTVSTASPSGISILSLCASDSAPGYHNYIRYNTIYGQQCGTYATTSDCNGGINDDMRHHNNPTACGSTPYTGATLWQYNIAFGNYGKGFHDWSSTNTVVFDHNTSYLNCQGPVCGSSDGDMDCLGTTGQEASGCVFTHNTIYAPNYAIRIKGLATDGTASADCNIEYGASGSKTANWDSSGAFTNTNYVSTNPNLGAPSTTPAGADFRPTSLTPALPAGC